MEDQGFGFKGYDYKDAGVPLALSCRRVTVLENIIA
jgi:hypothetical protein